MTLICFKRLCVSRFFIHIALFALFLCYCLRFVVAIVVTIYNYFVSILMIKECCANFALQNSEQQHTNKNKINKIETDWNDNKKNKNRWKTKTAHNRMRIESNRRTVERLKNGYLQPNRLVLRFTLTIYCYDLDFIVPLNCFVNDRCILDGWLRIFRSKLIKD